MSDKPNRTTNLRHSVTSTLNEAIKIFDAVPMSDDVLLSYKLAAYTTRAALFHSSLEIGMKCMSPAHKNTHQLVKIYRGLSKSDRELLDKAFKDAVSFYDFQVNRKEWQHMRDFDTYLAETGDKDLFLNLRYWALEGETDLAQWRMPDLQINREMVRFISDVIRGAGKVGEGDFVSQLVDIAVQKSFDQKGYEDNGNSRRSNKEHEALEEDNRILRRWAVNEHGSLLLALKYAYEHNFDVLNDWGNTVLISVYRALKDTIDYRTRPALDYAFSKFGAKSSDCDAISSAQVEQVGSWEQVTTPSGSPLGFITERHDSLWMAEDARARWQLAVSREDAIGLLIENGTEIVSVALNGEAFKDARIYSPDGNYFGEDREVFCEFWDNDHGIVSGDEITIKVITRSNIRFHGKVTSVKDHDVRIAVSKDN